MADAEIEKVRAMLEAIGQLGVGRLPPPIDRPEVVALLDQDGPDPLEDAFAAPPVVPAVDRAIVAELLRQPIPPAAAAEAEDDPIESRSQVDARTAACAHLESGSHIGKVVIRYPAP